MESKKKIKILLVDDEKDYVNVLANRLKKRGFDVEKTYSGTEAISKIRHTDFDVAVLDLKMEDMDGLEVLKIFKTILPEMHVIMLTGHGSPESSKEGILLGAFAYLAKPCEFSELLETIKKSVLK